MATSGISRKLNLTRDQLSAFLTDQQQIRQFERLFSTVDELQAIVGTDFEYQADTAAATANSALAQIAALTQESVINCALAESKANQALALVDKLTKAVEGLQMQPAMQIGKEVIVPQYWIDLVSRVSIAAGTSTVAGIAGDVRRHQRTGYADVFRFIPSNSDPLLDAFYSAFSASVLSGLIVSRK